MSEFGLGVWNFFQLILAILCALTIIVICIAGVVAIAITFIAVDFLLWAGLIKEPDEETFFLGLMPRNEGQSFTGSMVDICGLAIRKLRGTTPSVS